MRILFVSNYYPPFEVGGYEQLCKDVAERLQARGHHVAVLTSDHRVEGRQANHDADVHRDLYLGPSRSSSLPVWLEFFALRRARTGRNLARLNQLVEAFRPDVAFIWNLQGLPIELAAACEERRDVAVAYWLAGYSPAEADGYWRYWEYLPAGRLTRFVKRAAGSVAFRIMASEGKPVRPQMKHVAVVSQTMLERGLSEGTLPASAEVIYNGVEYNSFYRPVKPTGQSRLRILFAGRVSDDKGVHTVLEALAQLQSGGHSAGASLSIAGSGPDEYRQMLEELIADGGIEDSVQFAGFVPREQMPQLMARHDVLVLPSIYPEAFSRVVLEGMAAGLAVVGSTAGGTGELLVDGENGFTFSPGDSRELAVKLLLLIEDDERRQQVALAGQKLVQRSFTMELMVDKIERFLLDAIAVD
jgi:glycogen(starch) synthase